MKQERYTPSIYIDNAEERYEFLLSYFKQQRITFPTVSNSKKTFPIINGLRSSLVGTHTRSRLVAKSPESGIILPGRVNARVQALTHHVITTNRDLFLLKKQDQTLTSPLFIFPNRITREINDNFQDVMKNYLEFFLIVEEKFHYDKDNYHGYNLADFNEIKLTFMELFQPTRKPINWNAELLLDNSIKISGFEDVLQKTELLLRTKAWSQFTKLSRSLDTLNRSIVIGVRRESKGRSDQALLNNIVNSFSTLNLGTAALFYDLTVLDLYRKHINQSILN